MLRETRCTYLVGQVCNTNAIEWRGGGGHSSVQNEVDVEGNNEDVDEAKNQKWFEKVVSVCAC